MPASALPERENRVEAWLQRRRSNYLVLLAGLALFWLILDSIAAAALTLAGLAPPDGFFITRLFHPARVIDPDARQIVVLRGPSTAGYMDRFEADGLLGQRLVPSFLTTTPPPWGGWVQPSFWFMTNPQGFPPVRSGPAALKPYAIPKPAGVFRLVMLGGSTVEGNGVNTPFDSLPSKLLQQLTRRFDASAHPGWDRIQVINAGVSNYASDQEYLHLLADLLPLQPDLVLVYDGWNDSEVLPGAIMGGPQTRYYRPWSQVDNADRVNATFTIGGAFKDFATVASGHFLAAADGLATFYVLDKVMGFMIKRIGAAVALHHPAQSSAFDPSPSVTAAKLFQDNRERMLFLAAQQHFRFASILQPIMTVDNKPYSADEEEILRNLSSRQRQERQAFYQAVRPRLAELDRANSNDGKVCIKDVSTESFASHRERLYSDSGHLNAAGNEIVAAKIIDDLASCHLLWSGSDAPVSPE